MKHEKGISPWVVILLIVVIVGAAILWSKYFAKPMATIVTEGAEQAQPAIDKAHKTSDLINQANKITEEADKKLNEKFEQEK